MTLSFIVAMTRRRVMGKNNQLPWNLPGDLKHFKNVTFGYPIVMGRKTFDSIGRPLPGRENIVITRDPNWKHEGVVVFNQIDQAIHHCDNLSEKVFVIGGAEIFKLAFPLVHEMHITWIEQDFEGDVYFPEWDESQFSLLSEKKVEDSIPHSFCLYRRN